MSDAEKKRIQLEIARLSGNTYTSPPGLLTNNNPPQAQSTAIHTMPTTIRINPRTHLQETIQEEGPVELQALEAVDEAEEVLTPLI